MLFRSFLAITPRSGLALKHRISIPNSPGIVDSDYRDEVKVIIENRGENDFIINAGDRICQGLILFAPKPKIEFITEEEFNKNTTERTGGFGSTGINKMTNLFELIKNNDLEGVIKAIENGADVNLKDEWGRTALDIAEKQGNQEMIDLLKKAIDK